MQFHNLKYGKSYEGHLFFAEILPDLWKPVAKNLYDAIRDGIVHIYDTKAIRSGSIQLTIVISWKKRRHLHLSKNAKKLYINVPKLAEDLTDAISRFEKELKSDSNLRDTFFKSMKRNRELNLTKTETENWKRVLAQAPIETT